MVNRYGRDGFWRNQTMIQLRAKPANNMDLALYMAPLLEKGYARTPTDANNINQWSANWDTPERHRMFAELRDGKLGNYILINDHNYLAEEGALSASGKRQPRDKYTYTYDDQGNWTEVVQNSHSNEKGWFVVFRYVRQNAYAAGPAGANRK